MKLLEDGELQLEVLALTKRLALDLLHVFDDVVSTTVLDFAALVASADGNDCGTGSDTSADT